jgi:hypothetical protein
MWKMVTYEAMIQFIFVTTDAQIFKDYCGGFVVIPKPSPFRKGASPLARVMLCPLD